MVNLPLSSSCPQPALKLYWSQQCSIQQHPAEACQICKIRLFICWIQGRQRQPNYTALSVQSTYFKWNKNDGNERTTLDNIADVAQNTKYVTKAILVLQVENNDGVINTETRDNIEKFLYIVPAGDWTQEFKKWKLVCNGLDYRFIKENVKSFWFRRTWCIVIKLEKYEIVQKQ